MADHSLPTLSSTYTDFLAKLDLRLDDLAAGLDPASVTPGNPSITNLPNNSIRWLSASSKWEKYVNSAWQDLASSYGISISGNAATATKLAVARNINGVAFDGTTAISINLNTATTFNSSGTGAASGITFDGSAARTISYNTIGAPSVTGTNATGTWGISITGNAATVTDGVYLTGAQSVGGVKSFTNAVREKSSVIINADIDLSLANHFTKTITAATTFTLTNVPATGTFMSFVLELSNAGGYTITWWSNVKWPGGIAPTLSTSGRDVIMFFTHNAGTTWTAILAGRDVK